jgi:hypothetical protein
MAGHSIKRPSRGCVPHTGTTWNAFYELELSTSHDITDLAKRAIDSAHAIRTQDSWDEISRYSYQTGDDLAIKDRERSGSVKRSRLEPARFFRRSTRN